MTPEQNIYYAMGQVAYSIAMADGKIQKEERDQFHRFMKKETSQNINFDYGDIIFQILEKDHMPMETVFNWALKEISNNKKALSPEIKTKILELVNKVAEAYPPSTEREKELIGEFGKNLDRI